MTGATNNYRKQQDKITKLLMRLDEGLKAHAQEQAKEPRNYGYAGDLDYIVSLLQNASDFINQEGEEYE